MNNIFININSEHNDSFLDESKLSQKTKGSAEREYKEYNNIFINPN
jgi:hypothetical protein